jgi:hypothetical protein
MTTPETRCECGHDLTFNRFGALYLVCPSCGADTPTMRAAVAQTGKFYGTPDSTEDDKR